MNIYIAVINPNIFFPLKMKYNNAQKTNNEIRSSKTNKLGRPPTDMISSSPKPIRRCPAERGNAVNPKNNDTATLSRKGTGSCGYIRTKFRHETNKAIR